MFAWLGQNIWTILIVAVLAAAVAGIIIKLVKDKKKGKSNCGCNCSCCPMSGTCHGKTR